MITAKIKVEDEVRAQIQEIEKHKWFMSQRLGHDVGEQAYIDWIEKYALYWRKIQMYCDKFKINRLIVENELEMTMREMTDFYLNKGHTSSEVEYIKLSWLDNVFSTWLFHLWEMCRPLKYLTRGKSKVK